MDTEFTLFLTHVGNLTTVKSNQRRFAPTPAHITGITCPHHRNTQLLITIRTGLSMGSDFLGGSSTLECAIYEAIVLDFP